MRKLLNINKWSIYLSVLVCFVGLSSCNDDDDINYSDLLPDALVTVKTASDNSVFLQLDDKTTLFPVNMETSPFGEKEVRAFVNFDEVDEPSGEYTKAIYVNWIDSILTKNMAPNLGEDNDKTYGTDPVEIVRNWVTIAEDGYLTLRFRTLWGHSGQAHLVNLVSTNNPDNPYEVEFRHNAYGDVHGRWGDGIVAFNLNSLPDTEGKTVKLTLKWKAFEEDKSVEFDYCTQGGCTSTSPDIAKTRNELILK